MNCNQKPLTTLHLNTKAKIVTFLGGHRLQNKLSILGIRKDRIIQIISKQPLHGPLTISIDNRQVTIGRGMAQKIIIEEL